MFSKRRSIINLIISSLKEIDGSISPFDSSYTFASNVFNNVFRGAGNFENINDFPYITVQGGIERYHYNTVGNTEGSLGILLRCYVHNGDRVTLKTDVDNLIQDIDHVIYKMSTQVHNIHTIHIDSIESTQALLEDYCIIEIQLSVHHELDSI